MRGGELVCTASVSPRRLQPAAVALAVALAFAFGSAPVHADTVLHRGQTFEVEARKPGVEDLWLTPVDLERVSGFVLKPEGACLDEICVPTDDALIEDDGSGRSFNLSLLARRLDQALVVDRDTRVFSFGPVPATRASFLRGARAPDFDLPDRSGEHVQLADFRGKKILLVTWASW